jgi:hypothetical protein
MQMTSRIEQRDRLLIGLGLLVDPIRRLVFSDEDQRARIPYVRSEFQRDFDLFEREVRGFCQLGNHTFEMEYDTILREVRHFVHFLGMILYPENVEEARVKFPQQLAEVQKAIRVVPCDDPGSILPAHTPYATYIRLGAMFRAATTRLELFDPYLEPDTFHRYMPTIPVGVQVTIVTSGKIMDLPVAPLSRDALRRDGIVSTSELLATQFPDRYQFRVSHEQHDRHVRIDDTILHLGGSAKDAGKTDYFTISNLDPIQSTHGFLDGIIGRASEWYGPTVKPHRRA